MMKRRLLPILLMLCMLLTLLPGTIWADEANKVDEADETNEVDETDGADDTDEEQTPPVSGLCGDNLTWSYSDGILIIQGTGNMYDNDTAEGTTQLGSGYEIHTVIIGDGVTTIGEYAFWSFGSLTGVSIPSTVTGIGKGAFSGCSGLTDVTIPDSVTTIGDGTFSDCGSLTEVYYGGSESRWEQIEIGEDNAPLLDAAIHCYGITPGVKYVYYSVALPDSWQAIPESLPDWLHENGNVLSGIPTEADEYSISLSDGSDTQTVTLTVRENGDNSVRTSISKEYVIVQDLPDIAQEDSIWIIDDAQASATEEGDIFERLLDVYLDGRKLTGGKLADGDDVPDDWEYYARPGSVQITVTAMRKTKGSHTLSATFTKPTGGSAVDTVSTNYYVGSYDPQTEDYPFKDGAETRYRDAIRAMAEPGIINGFDDGTFRPKSGLTRAEACVILARATGNGITSGSASFTDTSGHWAENVIAWCASNGIISGYGDGRFGPDDPLTGYAWSRMLFSALGFDLANLGISGSNWEGGIMGLLRSYGMDQGMNNFYPKQTIEREEACQLVYNALLQKLIDFSDIHYVADSDGSNVYMIGDSITYISQSKIKEILPNITINAKSGIWFSKYDSDFGASGTERIAQMGDQSILVFALGSNGGVNNDDIDALFAALEGKNVKIILMTIYYSGGWASTQMNNTNAVIKAAAQRYSNVTYMDWYAAAAAHPGYVYNVSGDHVHPTNPNGMMGFAQTVKEAIDRVSYGGN